MVDATAKDTACTALLKYYCELKSAADGINKVFIEPKTVDYGACFGGGTEG